MVQTLHFTNGSRSWSIQQTMAEYPSRKKTISNYTIYRHLWAQSEGSSSDWFVTSMRLSRNSSPCEAVGSSSTYFLVANNPSITSPHSTLVAASPTMCVIEKRVYSYSDGSERTVEQTKYCHHAVGSRVCNRSEERTVQQAQVLERRPSRVRRRHIQHLERSTTSSQRRAGIGYASSHSLSNPVEDSDESPDLGPSAAVRSSTGRYERTPAGSADEEPFSSEPEDREAFQAALGFAGLSLNADSRSSSEDGSGLEELTQSTRPPRVRSARRPSLPSLHTNREDLDDPVSVHLDDVPELRLEDLPSEELLDTVRTQIQSINRSDILVKAAKVDADASPYEDLRVRYSPLSDNETQVPKSGLDISSITPPRSPCLAASSRGMFSVDVTLWTRVHAFVASTSHSTTGPTN
jgi:hypothetical protein